MIPTSGEDDALATRIEPVPRAPRPGVQAAAAASLALFFAFLAMGSFSFLLLRLFFFTSRFRNFFLIFFDFFSNMARPFFRKKNGQNRHGFFLIFLVFFSVANGTQ